MWIFYLFNFIFPLFAFQNFFLFCFLWVVVVVNVVNVVNVVDVDDAIVIIVVVVVLLLSTAYTAEFCCRSFQNVSFTSIFQILFAIVEQPSFFF